MLPKLTIIWKLNFLKENLKVKETCITVDKERLDGKHLFQKLSKYIFNIKIGKKDIGKLMLREEKNIIVIYYKRE